MDELLKSYEMGLQDFKTTLVWIKNIYEQSFHTLGKKHLAYPYQFAKCLSISQ